MLEGVQEVVNSIGSILNKAAKYKPREDEGGSGRLSSE